MSKEYYSHVHTGDYELVFQTDEKKAYTDVEAYVRRVIDGKKTRIKLIDAAEVKRFYEEEFPDLDNGVHWSRNDIICNLDNIPTVKAIPVEWIEKWMLDNWELECNYGIEQMIEDWEKGNE